MGTIVDARRSTDIRTSDIDPWWFNNITEPISASVGTLGITGTRATMADTRATMADTTISTVVMVLEGIRWAVRTAVERSHLAVPTAAATARSLVVDRMAVVAFPYTLDASVALSIVAF